jgi:hypothetical protein
MKRLLAIVFAIFLSTVPAMNILAQSYAPLQISLVPGVALPFGAPASGIVLGAVGNVSGRVDLLQAAGVFNIADQIRGIQAAGVFNIASAGMEGIQAAGVFNIAEERRTPVQMAGVFNVATSVQGFQAAGVFNVSGRVQGAQFSSIFNVADNVEGFQVGLINIADNVKGFQLGLVNISSNGVFDLIVGWEPETEFARATFKTGNTSLFAVYSVASPKSDVFRAIDTSIVSAGLGTRIGDSRSLFIDVSVSASQSIGPDAELFFDAWHYRNGLTPWDVFAPWPTLDASLNLKLGGLHIIGGLRTDINLQSAPNLPSILERGMAYSNTWFGESFTAWTTWYVGIGI